MFFQNSKSEIGLITTLLIFLFKEPGEAINKDLKSFQLNHAPHTDAISRNVAVFDRLMDRSDQELLRHYSKLSKISLDKAKEPYSAELLALCRKDYLDSQGNFVVDSERVIVI